MSSIKFGKKVWENKYLTISESQNRLLLVDKLNGDLLAELISGQEGLKKYYKNSYEYFVQLICIKRIEAREREIIYFQRQINHQIQLRDYWNKLSK